ncbi:MAG: FAD-dependent thymidylate synthase [Candidatus Wallbacteria bacterium]|nr:FAD-dependent thymidylate synthase [Candidatus Wallbacteria bacterium]
MTSTAGRKPARVVALAPMPPEPQAYALARYSRSPDSIQQSLEWVHAHSAEKFWEKFYFDYGHASIADLGHVAICFENISELAALEILDEQTWDGQQRSTRYQDGAGAACALPPEIASPKLAAEYDAAAARLFARYTEVHEKSIAALAQKLTRPDSMSQEAFDRNLAARAYDVARYLLPLGAPTSLGQVVSIRTLERQISRLLVSEYGEVRAIGEMLRQACSEPPDATWPRLESSGTATGPLAPTLARHAQPSEYQRAVRSQARALAARFLDGLKASGGPDVHLIRPHSPESELASTLLYSQSNLPYAKVLGRLEACTIDERRWVIHEVLGDRGPHDELPRAARAGHRFLFDISMDIGGWRDLHRHRRCDQILQPFDLLAGSQFPEGAGELGVLGLMEDAYSDAFEAARRIADEAGPLAAHYLLPFAHRVRCLFKMDFAEADYMCRLRSGTKGHPSYRKVAWEMAEAVKVAEPGLADLIEATPPWVEDPLKR